MTVTIYIDVLICINFIVNYFILSLSFKYVKCKVKTFALLRGAFLGAILSLIILLPELPVFLSVLTKLAVGVAVVFFTSFKKPLKIFLKLYSVFIFITFALCGSVYFLYITFLPEMFYIRNGTVYADISPLILICSTGFCYIIFTIIDHFTGKSLPKSFYCNISFEIDGRDYELFGKIDTGNSLKEPFSQSPVIIVNRQALKIAMSDFESRSDIRIIPYNSVGGKGILTGIKAQNLKIDHTPVLCEVYLAICENAINTSGVDALLSCELTEYLDKNYNTENMKTRSKHYETIGKD